MYSMTSLLGRIPDHGSVTNPECGSGYSVPEGHGLSFFCRPPLYGRYVTIRSLQMNFALTLCEVEVYSERRGTLFVDAYDNKGDNGGQVMIHSFIYSMIHVHVYLVKNWNSFCIKL